MHVTLEMIDARGPDTWGGRQPKFDGLACDGPGRFLLVYRGKSEEQVRVQLAPASYHSQPGD